MVEIIKEKISEFLLYKNVELFMQEKNSVGKWSIRKCYTKSDNKHSVFPITIKTPVDGWPKDVTRHCIKTLYFWCKHMGKYVVIIQRCNLGVPGWLNDFGHLTLGFCWGQDLRIMRLGPMPGYTLDVESACPPPSTLPPPPRSHVYTHARTHTHSLSLPPSLK